MKDLKLQGILRARAGLQGCLLEAPIMCPKAMKPTIRIRIHVPDSDAGRGWSIGARGPWLEAQQCSLGRTVVDVRR